MSENIFIVWKNEFSVGSKVLNAQHRRLFDIINELYQAMQQDSSQNHLIEIIKMLSQYSATHFAYEEKIMREFNFPDLEEQQKAHQYFRKRVDAFNVQLKTIQGDLSLEVLTFLKDWLINHILHMDMEYGPFIKSGAAGEENHGQNRMG
jgi:hemerythrin